MRNYKQNLWYFLTKKPHFSSCFWKVANFNFLAYFRKLHQNVQKSPNSKVAIHNPLFESNFIINRNYMGLFCLVLEGHLFIICLIKPTFVFFCSYAWHSTALPDLTIPVFFKSLTLFYIYRCFQTLENRNLEDQGLYRIVGVTSKVTKLLTTGLDKKKAEKMNLDEPIEWETKTITSAAKTFLRNLPEPLMTFRMHTKFIEAASKSY